MDELLGKLQTEIYAPLLKSTLEVELPKNLEKLVRELFQFSMQLDDISEKILQSQGNFPIGQSPSDYALKSLFHYSQPNGNPSDCDVVKNNIIAAYLNGSLSFIYSQWVFDKRKLPLETLIQLTTQLIAKGIGLGLPIVDEL